MCSSSAGSIPLGPLVGQRRALHSRKMYCSHPKVRLVCNICHFNTKASRYGILIDDATDLQQTVCEIYWLTVFGCFCRSARRDSEFSASPIGWWECALLQRTILEQTVLQLVCCHEYLVAHFWFVTTCTGKFVLLSGSVATSAENCPRTGLKRPWGSD